MTTRRETNRREGFISGGRLLAIVLLMLIAAGAMLIAFSRALAYASLADPAQPTVSTWMQIVVWMKAAVTWILIAGPSLITALSHDPITTPAANWLQMVWNHVKNFCDIFSVLTFKNSPGTLQLPLKLGRGDPNGTGPAIILLVAGAMASTSCAWAQKHGAQVLSDVVDCGKAAVAAEALVIGPAVLQILAGGSVDWSAELDALRSHGADALVCAVQAVAASMRGPEGAGPWPARARAYIAGVKFKAGR